MNISPDATILQLVLNGETDVIVRRDFTHPPARVWRALTEPDLIPLWLSSRDSKLRCEMDVRPGGSFRYEWDEFTFFGPILEVDAPRRMTQVQHFSKDPAYRVEVTIDLVARGTGTRMTHLMRYADADARASAIAVGFTDGLSEVFGRIEAVLTAQ